MGKAKNRKIKTLIRIPKYKIRIRKRGIKTLIRIPKYKKKNLNYRTRNFKFKLRN